MFGVFVLALIGRGDAINLRSFEQCVASHFRRAQGRCRIGCEERIARARCENDNPAFFHMSDGAAANVRLTDMGHLDRRHDPRVKALTFQRILQRKRVHHRREHAHIVGACPLHAARGLTDAAKDIAAADHETKLDAELLGLANFPGDTRHGLVVDAVLAGAHQRLTRHLEKDTPEFEVCRGRDFVGSSGRFTHSYCS